MEQAADLAAQVPDQETRIVSLMMLAPALGYQGKLGEAQRRYEEVISLCVANGDRFHLGGAYGNRVMLWQKEPARALEDLRKTVEIAREVGHPPGGLLAVGGHR